MDQARVIVIRGKEIFLPTGDVNPKAVDRIFDRGIQHITGQPDSRQGLARLFSRNDRVGIKINTIGGRKLSTRPELPLCLAKGLAGGGIPEKNIIIWDRLNRELKEAGYRLNMASQGFKIFGTDTEGAGYESELFSSDNIGSLFSTIQSNFVTASISLALLKDHGLAGITAGMKNYFGAIHNPNKYHDANCNPFIAELFDSPPVKDKHRLTVLDSLIVQYHRGPSFHAQWAEKFGALIFSRDPVAADFVGWQIIEKLRSQKGLPPLKEERREPGYLQTAAKMGLGILGSKQVQIIEDEV